MKGLVQPVTTVRGAVQAGSRLEQARLIIEAEYAAPLTALRLARRLRLPRLAFHQGFIDAFGTSPQGYLRRCRMLAAARLLADGIDRHAVAQRVGYAGLTPFAADYRREFRGDPERVRLL